MERTNFPATTQGGGVVKITRKEITEVLDQSEVVKLELITTDIHCSLINIKNDVYKIGKRLHQVKDLLPHGMFTPWIELTFGTELKYPTAHLYMKVYEVFKDYPKTIQCIPFKYLIMVTSSQFPKEIVAVLNDHPEKIQKEFLEEVRLNYDDFKKGKISSNQFIELSKDQIKIGIELWAGKSKHRLNANFRRPYEMGAKDILTRIKELRKVNRDLSGSFPPDPTNEDYKEIIKLVTEAIDSLKELRTDLEGGGGFWHRISTDTGEEYVPNI